MIPYLGFETKVSQTLNFLQVGKERTPYRQYKTAASFVHFAFFLTPCAKHTDKAKSWSLRGVSDGNKLFWCQLSIGIPRVRDLHRMATKKNLNTWVFQVSQYITMISEFAPNHNFSSLFFFNQIKHKKSQLNPFLSHHFIMNAPMPCTTYYMNLCALLRWICYGD